MEKENKPLLFKNLSTTKTINESSASKEEKESVGVEFVKSIKANSKEVAIKKDVTMLVVLDEEEDYSTIKTITDVLALDARKPNNIIGFIPALHESFINKVKKTLLTHVNIGDTVIMKPKYTDEKGKIPRKVKDLYFKSLNNMTIIIAILDDDDFHIANLLQKV